MKKNYSPLNLWLLLLCWAMLPAWAAQAQTPAWTQAAAGGAATGTAPTTSESQAQATAVDDAGNVFVAGWFTGQVTFGSTVLTSAGQEDIFLAKYAPATGQWIWAERAGGTGRDQGYGLATAGANVYLTGFITNTRSDAQRVRFGNNVTQLGASIGPNADLVLAKYVDNGASASLAWTQVGGGRLADCGSGVAVSGNSVYVGGMIRNDRADHLVVRFGGSGTTPATVAQAGASTAPDNDLVLVKYTDNGSSATLRWTQVGGGTGSDAGMAVAVQGRSVYLAGYVENTATDADSVRFGGSGLVPGTVRQYGNSAYYNGDIVLVKYIDNDTAAVVGWTQAGGGRFHDEATGVAVSGNSVYLTGYVTSETQDGAGIRFGAAGTALGTAVQWGASDQSTDLILAKYTDNGTSATLGWTQVAGGRHVDTGFAVAAEGANVYVAGLLTNSSTDISTARFGGSGSTPGTIVRGGASAIESFDLVLAKYTDLGPRATLAWAQVGGGTSDDRGIGLAVRNGRAYVAGYFTDAASFGRTNLANSIGGSATVVAVVNEGAPLALASPTRAAGFHLYPNPATGSFTLLLPAEAGATQAEATLFNALGQRVRTQTVALPASGARATFDARKLAAGVYLLQVQAGEYTVSRRVTLY
ncbi:T9SS type A sorting domain-containing protein [Hymenobacter jeollabukensis]|uniref:T9SS type A sorting domain-containing protein n=1 Tax=Hymenobacter jeollabukensis TaxID=2025313 RepID=A0A5R8WKU6_9BACT|nr:T9SS type A sorting domain-containing protein [Hymenobacter jeollabukensis]TLM89530.1 T9SS type A sorting domain-containing protein [Hymenobacter jeollabukensis]